MASLQRTSPRRPATQLRVAELLAAARAVFSEHGYQRATTAQIAERAGVSEATVFTYFAGKRELCIQVIKDWYDEISSELEASLPEMASMQQQLAHVVSRHLVTLLAEGSGLCALVLGEGRTSTAPELADVITECKRRYTAPLMNCLSHARARGEIRADVPLRLLRDLIYGAMEHVLWDAVITRKRPPIDETADQLTGLIWSALMPPAESASPASGTASLAALETFRREVARALNQLDRQLPCP